MGSEVLLGRKVIQPKANNFLRTTESGVLLGRKAILLKAR